MFQDSSTPVGDYAIHVNESRLIRICDLLFCLSCLAWLLPLFLTIGAAIKLTSPGPVFYRAKRAGKDGKVFTLLKFRSMYVDADQQGPGITVHDDDRVTSVGRFLRRTKLDELPQLINVMRGEMSLVGPRPEDPAYVGLYSNAQRLALSVLPGLTSPASLRYSQEETLLIGDDWESVHSLYVEKILPHKLSLDLAYIRHRTLRSYFAVLFATGATVFRAETVCKRISSMRNRYLLLFDFLAFLAIPSMALALRLDVPIWTLQLSQALVFYTLVSAAVKLAIFYQLGLYRRNWRYVDTDDIAMISFAVGLSSLTLTLIFSWSHSLLGEYDLAIERTVPLIGGLLTGLAAYGSRLVVRFAHEWRRQPRYITGRHNVLVVGAGTAGAMVLQEIKENPNLDMQVAAFVDDDPSKINTYIRGIPVVGPCQDIHEYVDDYEIDHIIIALPSVEGKRRREIIERCEATGIKTQSVPGVYELLAGHKSVNAVPTPDPNRLLNRSPLKIDQTEVATSLKGQTVLVTGAGGSIGSELCCQIANFGPAKLILLGHGENSIFEIGLELRISFPDLSIEQVIADVRDQRRINQIIQRYRPQAVFHAAAHKHVPFMEANIEDAISTNIRGTRNVLQAAERYGVERFVLISTDKAINPTSIMGATKRVAELLVQSAARRSGRAYVAVRFGNVLGSRGSVLPIFQRQIAAGGPLTITHPEMVRYFMTIPEAVQLVLQASVLGRGSEIFVLDMGEQIRILDLAVNLIEMYGLDRGSDIDIVYSGIRPGEKLREELFQASEDHRRTKHEKIFVVTDSNADASEEAENHISSLIELAERLHTHAAINQLRTIIPEYCPPLPPPSPEAAAVQRLPVRPGALVVEAAAA